jgi:hypothetical protein
VSGARLVFEYVLPDPEHNAVVQVFLVAGYLAAASLWRRAGQKTKLAADSFRWRLGAVLLFLLALNKTFKLRLVAESALRAVAKSGDWYDRRQPVQFAVAILLPSVCAVLTAIFLGLKGRTFLRRHRPALAGWIMLLLYLSIRQSQEWKPILPWLQTVGYYNWRLALEAGGIALVLFDPLVRDEDASMSR